MTDNSCSSVNTSHVAWTIFVAIKVIATIMWKLALASCPKVIFPTFKLPKPWCILCLDTLHEEAWKSPVSCPERWGMGGGGGGKGGYYFKHV